MMADPTRLSAEFRNALLGVLIVAVDTQPAATRKDSGRWHGGAGALLGHIRHPDHDGGAC
jgi:hypothetical protein